MADVDRARVIAARAIVDAYYALDNPAGGTLHVVTDEGGVSDEIVKGSIEFAKRYSDDAGEAVGEMLLALPLEERKLVVADFDDPVLAELLAA